LVRRGREHLGSLRPCGLQYRIHLMGAEEGQSNTAGLPAGSGDSRGREAGSPGETGPDQSLALTVPGYDAFDELFEQALTDHDRMLLWLFHIWVATGLDAEWANRDRNLSLKLSHERQH